MFVAAGFKGFIEVAEGIVFFYIYGLRGSFFT